MKNLIYILLCVFMIAIGQVLLKFGVSGTHENIPLISITTIRSLVGNVYFLSGAALYGISFILWLYVLSNVRVSYAYPFLSLSYPLVVILSNALLGEPFSKGAWVGVILISIGVCIIGFCMKG